MAIIKCKMCGGELNLTEGATVAKCEYCGTTQTLPRLDNDKKANLYDRANHFRRNNDYDKAITIYEQILNEDTTDAEAYWSLVLCRYGIEYVEDPTSHRRVPTVNRAQFTSIFADEDYKSAIANADSFQKEIYEAEAKAIDDIQKGILAISSKEEPFDVFICYKETDDNGRRTPDSVLANDLYYQLTQEGFKVFFARITLEDKLGTAYEPYIFAALNSSKVMVVLGTKPEYFNAVWVKNEWSRFLALIKAGNKKVLIPAYKDMDPYNLPEEFSHLQAQDMSKLGFMQDLIRGIKKITQSEQSKETKNTADVSSSDHTITNPLLRRAFLFLEDGNWETADNYCEQVLNQEPENALAYLGKLLAEMQINKPEELSNYDDFENKSNFQKALRFADDKLAATLNGYIDEREKYLIQVKEKKRLSELYELYKEAVEIMENAATGQEYYQAYKKFESVSGFKDSDSLAETCFEKIYSFAVSEMQSANTEEHYRNAADLFNLISGFKDSDALAGECLKQISLESKYSYAVKAMKMATTEEQYNSAANIFKSISGFKDSDDLADSCMQQIKHSAYNHIMRIIEKNQEWKVNWLGRERETINELERSISELESIISLEDYKKQLGSLSENANNEIEDCRKIINEIESALKNRKSRMQEGLAQSQKKEKRIKRIIIIGIIVAIIVVTVIIISAVNINQQNEINQRNYAIEVISKWENL